jgi:hypothetical protein
MRGGVGRLQFDRMAEQLQIGAEQQRDIGVVAPHLAMRFGALLERIRCAA